MFNKQKADIFHVSDKLVMSLNMANIFLVSHILLLFRQNKSAKYEKLGKYWPYCTRNHGITNACLTEPSKIFFTNTFHLKLSTVMTEIHLG